MFFSFRWLDFVVASQSNEEIFAFHSIFFLLIAFFIFFSAIISSHLQASTSFYQISVQFIPCLPASFHRTLFFFCQWYRCLPCFFLLLSHSVQNIFIYFARWNGSLLVIHFASLFDIIINFFFSVSCVYIECHPYCLLLFVPFVFFDFFSSSVCSRSLRLISHKSASTMISMYLMGS